MKARSVAAILAIVVASTAFAESIWVKSDVADIRSGKAAIYPSVGRVKKGQELVVLSRDGKWIQVQAGSVQGWIYDTSVSTQQVSGFTLGGGNATAQMDTGAAARGWNQDAEAYASSRHLSTQGLDSLKVIRDSIKPEEYISFTTQGHVGAH